MLPINIDCGEKIGASHLENDEVIIKNAQLINVACGYHAGDASTMLRCIQMAKETNVYIGAHPSFPDIEGFGRSHMDIDKATLYSLILHQICALYGMCQSQGVAMYHVKPHGALYNTACKSEKEAMAIVEAMYDLDKKLILLAPQGSVLAQCGMHKGLTVMHEAFADRKYMPELSLKPRNLAGAFFSEIDEIKKQFNNISDNFVIADDGQKYTIHAQTVCIHGEHENIAQILKNIYEDQ